MRLDVFLTTEGLASTRSKAQKFIDEGRVIVNGVVVSKSSFDVCENDSVSVADSDKNEYVGRGGYKLEHALKCFDIDCNNKICLDIGASTGGFTQCLLMNGANRVYAVDSGKGQLASELLCDERVVSIEGFNARNLVCETIDGNYAEIVVMDVSFISQKLLYPAILRVAKSNADVITLIKPLTAFKICELGFLYCLA